MPAFNSQGAPLWAQLLAGSGGAPIQANPNDPLVQGLNPVAPQVAPPMMPAPVAQPAAPTMTPDQAAETAAATAGTDAKKKQTLNEWLNSLTENPNAVAAMLTFAGGLLQPKGLGDTNAGQFGKALVGATNTFAAGQAGTKASEQAQQTIKLKGREVTATEAQVPSQNLLRTAQAGQAFRSPQASGEGSSAVLKAQQDAILLKSFANVFGLTDEKGMPTDEARVQFAMAQDKDFGTNIGTKAQRDAWTKQLETFQFLDEDLRDPAIAGATTGALSPANEIPADATDEEILAMEQKNPEWARQKFGPSWEARLYQISKKAKSK